MTSSAAVIKSRKEIARAPPRRRAFHSIVGHEGSYQCDIAFMPFSESHDMRKANNGYSCFLLLIEVPTRYAYARGLKTKGGADVAAAFADIYSIIDSSGLLFIDLRHDGGREFANAEWMRMMDAINTYRGNAGIGPIREIINDPGTHLSMAPIDRLTGTIKRALENHMLTEGTLEWIAPALSHALESYNRHKIRILGRTAAGKRSPGISASPEELRKYGTAYARVQAIDRERGRWGRANWQRFDVGDRVRIRLRPEEQPRAQSSLAHPSARVAKGTDRWSNVVYTIAGKSGYSFALVDTSGSSGARMYRAHELLKVGPDSVDVPDVFARAAHQARVERRRKREAL